MANHASALKRHRQNEKRNARNGIARSTLRTAIKKTIASVESGDAEQAKSLARKATSLLDKAAIHGLLHKKNAARRISRLNKKVASLEAK